MSAVVAEDHQFISVYISLYQLYYVVCHCVSIPTCVHSRATRALATLGSPQNSASGRGAAPQVLQATFSHLQTSANLHWNLRHCETLCDHHIQNSSKLINPEWSIAAPILRTNSSWRAQWNCNCRPLDSGAHMFCTKLGQLCPTQLS